MERARALALEGEGLIDNKHYAVDSIRPKCEELRHLCDQFSSEVSRRRGLLSKALELHNLLETVGGPSTMAPIREFRGSCVAELQHPLTRSDLLPSLHSSFCPPGGCSPDRHICL